MNRIDIEKKLHDLEQMAAICVACENISEFTERELKINKLVFDRIEAHVADLRAFLNLLPIQNVVKSCENCKHFKTCGHKHLAEQHDRICFNG